MLISPLISYSGKILQPASLISLFLLAGVLSTKHLYSDPTPVILAFGDSLTAGYQVPSSESYPAKLQEILHNQGHLYKVINGGISGDTSAGGVRRISWLMKHNPTIVILELGANDGLRGLPLDKMESNLSSIIKICQDKGARILLTGMKIPPNYGEEYSNSFEETYKRLAKRFRIPFMPFFLEGVAGKRQFTQNDGLHPLASGYEIVAKNVWKNLEPLL